MADTPSHRQLPSHSRNVSGLVNSDLFPSVSLSPVLAAIGLQQRPSPPYEIRAERSSETNAFCLLGSTTRWQSGPRLLPVSCDRMSVRQAKEKA